MGEVDDAAELAKAIRDEVVRWPGVESGGRQMGRPDRSSIDILTEDGRCFVVVVTEVEPSQRGLRVGEDRASG